MRTQSSGCCGHRRAAGAKSAPQGRGFHRARAAPARTLWNTPPAHRGRAATGQATAPARSESARRPARRGGAQRATRGSALCGLRRGRRAWGAHHPQAQEAHVRRVVARLHNLRRRRHLARRGARVRLRPGRHAPRRGCQSAARTSARGSAAVSSRCSCAAARGSAQGAAAEVRERRAARADAAAARADACSIASGILPARSARCSTRLRAGWEGGARLVRPSCGAPWAGRPLRQR